MKRKPQFTAQIKREELKMKYINYNASLLANEVLKCDIDNNIPKYTFNNIPPIRKHDYVSKIKYSSSKFTSVKLIINNKKMDSILTDLTLFQLIKTEDITPENEFICNEQFDFNLSSEEIQLREISQSTSEEMIQSINTNNKVIEFVKAIKQTTTLQQKIKLRKALKQ